MLYVAENSQLALPTMYKVSAVWGAHEGSLLLWALILAVWTGAVTWFSRSVPEVMLARRSLVEHPFGTMKSWTNSNHFLTKRLSGVSTETSLQVLAYNMKRAINLVGAKKIIEAIFSTHDHDIVKSFGQRVIVVNEGRITSPRSSRARRSASKARMLRPFRPMIRPSSGRPTGCWAKRSGPAASSFASVAPVSMPAPMSASVVITRCSPRRTDT